MRLLGCATRLASGHGLLVYLLVGLPNSRLANDCRGAEEDDAAVNRFQKARSR